MCIDYNTGKKVRRYMNHEDAMNRHRSIGDMFIWTLAILGVCGAAVLLALALMDMRDIPRETPQQRADSIGAARYEEARLSQ